MSIYVISGMVRTGTSMMMHALHAGGMDVVYDSQIDESRASFIRPDYNPNPNGYYEVDIDRLDNYNGKLIKVFGENLISLDSDHDMRIVYMRRSFDEIALSIALMTNKFGEVKPDPRCNNQDNYVRVLRNRKNVELLEFWYQEVLKEPFRHFKLLSEAGYPIDVEKCVATINPNYCHARGG